MIILCISLLVITKQTDSDLIIDKLFTMLADYTLIIL